jgi:peptidoglycan/LPS O-acetylase OafA/YrhL
MKAASRVPLGNERTDPPRGQTLGIGSTQLAASDHRRADSGRLPYWPALDGLRGLAVAAVLLFHGGFSWATGGYLGVSAFFTLSGFLITTLLLAEWRETGRISLRGFWSRRLRRLMPPALIGLAGAVVFGALVADNDQLHELRGDVVAALGYVANWRFIFSNQSYADLFAAPSPVLHFWSLAIEEQFYLCFPVIAVCTLSSRRRGGLGAFSIALVVAAACSFVAGLALVRSGASADRLYYGTDTRAFELMVGALLAVSVARFGLPQHRLIRRVTQAVGAFALVVILGMWASIAQSDRWLHRGGLLVHALLVAAVVLTAVQAHGPVRAVLRQEPFRRLGLISYGVYVYHWPVFLWLTEDRTAFSRVPLFALRVAVTLAISTLSYSLLERPIREGRRVNRWRPWVVVPAVAGTMCVALAAVTANPPPPAIAYGAVGDDRSLRRPPPAPGGSGGSAKPARIMVVGDSVGLSVGLGLERWGARTGAAVVDIAVVRWCSLSRGGVVHLFGTLPVDQRECGDWSRREIERFRPEVVVVLSTLWEIAPRSRPEWDGVRRIGEPDYDRWLAAEYGAATSFFLSQGARVVWLTSPCMRSNDAERVGSIERLNQIISTLPGEVSPGKLRIIDLFSRVCPAGRFVQRLGDIDARPDGVHFSDAGGDWLATWLGPELVDAALDAGRPVQTVPGAESAARATAFAPSSAARD